MIYRANISSVAVGMFLLFASINSKFQSREENNAKLGMEGKGNKSPTLLGSLATKAQCGNIYC
jgi:hypothetical protein